MTTYVALLYSVILDRTRRVVMADLRVVAAELGLENPRTLVATGNLVFSTPTAGISELETRLETAFAQRFGKHVDIIVRDAAAWRRLTAGNPFPEQSAAQPNQVAVRIMRQPVSAEAAAWLAARVAADERLSIVDGDPWIFFGRSAGTSRLISGFGHRLMGVGTSRNWNTVRGLCDMLAD